MRRYVVVIMAAMSAVALSPILAGSLNPAAALPIGVCQQGLGKCIIECEPTGGIEEAEDLTELGRCQQECRTKYDGCKASNFDPDAAVVKPGGGTQPSPGMKAPKVAPGVKAPTQ